MTAGLGLALVGASWSVMENGVQGVPSAVSSATGNSHRLEAQRSNPIDPRYDTDATPTHMSVLCNYHQPHQYPPLVPLCLRPISQAHVVQHAGGT